MTAGTTAGRLTVHVLDTALGRPASGLRYSLFRIGDIFRTELGFWHTNADGRCDTPLLTGPELLPGAYKDLFDVVPGESPRALLRRDSMT